MSYKPQLISGDSNKMKTVKNTIVAFTMVALGGIAAYAQCQSSIHVEVGLDLYRCGLIGRTSQGGCVYGNCQRIGFIRGERQVVAEEAEIAQ